MRIKGDMQVDTRWRMSGMPLACISGSIKGSNTVWILMQGVPVIHERLDFVECWTRIYNKGSFYRGF